MKHLILLLCVLLTPTAHALTIAVTDLTYSDQVSGYIHVVDYHNKSSVNSRYSDHNHGDGNHYSDSSNGAFNASSKTDYTEIESSYSYIEYGELRKFVGDIKGEILKAGGYKLSQAKPYTTEGSEKIYDIISRIKQGYYPGADYVLFGTVSELEFLNEANPVLNTNTLTNTFSLSLVAEFSLINTKTYQVKAAFSAKGDGQDVRIVNPGSIVSPSRAKTISEVSKSLGKDVAEQLFQQLDGRPDNTNAPADSSVNRHQQSQQNTEEVIHYYP
jgi:hypothetical protein